MRWVLIVIGVLMILAGGVWFLQGIGILLGSVMSSQPFWAMAGGVLLIAGAALCFLGLRRSTNAPGK